LEDGLAVLDETNGEELNGLEVNAFALPVGLVHHLLIPLLFLSVSQTQHFVVAFNGEVEVGRYTFIRVPNESPMLISL
jgi:pantothenate kinase